MNPFENNQPPQEQAPPKRETTSPEVKKARAVLKALELEKSLRISKQNRLNIAEKEIKELQGEKVGEVYEIKQSPIFSGGISEFTDIEILEKESSARKALSLEKQLRLQYQEKLEQAEAKLRALKEQAILNQEAKKPGTALMEVIHEGVVENGRENEVPNPILQEAPSLSTLVKISAQLKAKNLQIQELLKSIKTLESEKMTLAAGTAILSDKHLEFQEKIKELEETVASLEQEREDLEALKEGLESSNSAAIRQVGVAMGKVKALQIEKAELVRRVVDGEEIIKKLSSSVQVINQKSLLYRFLKKLKILS